MPIRMCVHVISCTGMRIDASRQQLSPYILPIIYGSEYNPHTSQHNMLTGPKRSTYDLHVSMAITFAYV